MRTAISAESDWDEAKDAGPKLLPCGYGPPCNPRDFGGQSCQLLGLQPGNLSCNPNTCFLVLTGCGRTIAGGAGSGSTGTGAPTTGTPGTTVPLDMDAGALFGGLFGAQAGTGAAMPGMTGTSMADEDGGVPTLFGAGFFGGNFFGAGFFGAGTAMDMGGTPGANFGAGDPNGDAPGEQAP